MVRSNKIKTGEIIDSKLMNNATQDVIRLHQRVKLNAVESEIKSKNLEKEVKERTLGEMKESSYRESKAPKVVEPNFVVIDEKGEKITKEKAIESIEKKSLDKQNEDLSIDINATNNGIELPQITTLSIELNELTNKEKLISYFGKNRVLFNEEHEALQVLTNVIMLAEAKKNGFNKDIDCVYIKPKGENDHYGSADLVYFNTKDNYFLTEQYKFNCRNLNKLSYYKPIDYEKMWELYFFNESTDRICISFADRSEYDNFIKFLNSTNLKLPYNFIVNDLSLLNEVDINFNKDNFIKHSIDKYLHDLNCNKYTYRNAEINYWNYFNSFEHKFETRYKFDEQFKLNKFDLINQELLKYNGDNKYEKTMDFHNYKFFETYECKPYPGSNDDLKSLNGDTINSDIRTVGNFRLNFTSSAQKGIDLNKNNKDDGNIN